MAPVMTERVVLAFAEIEIAVEVVPNRDGILVRLVQGDGKGTGDSVALTAERLAPAVYAVTLGRRRLIAHHAVDGDVHHLFVDGETYTYRRPRGGAAPRGGRPGAAHHHQDLGAPMPGLVTQIFVADGDAVDAGQPLFVIEAMKMENVVKAPAAGRVTRVHVPEGSRVDAGAIVVEVEEG
jgi:biotin carboxyl carrier protein